MRFTILLTIIGLTIVFDVNAVSERGGDSGGANAQTQALIQQLGAERTRLTAENAKLKKQVKDLEKEVESIKADSESKNAQAASEINSTRQQLAAKTELSDELLSRLKDAKSKFDELVAKFRETISNLHKVENESAQRGQEIVRLNDELKSCATSNVELSRLGIEVLDNYENKGFWDRAGQKEPFTQIKRVQIENLVDDYKYLIEDQEYRLPDDISNDAQS